MIDRMGWISLDGTIWIFAGAKCGAIDILLLLVFWVEGLLQLFECESFAGVVGCGRLFHRLLASGFPRLFLTVGVL